MAHCRRRAALPSTDRWFVSRPMHVREQSSLKALLAFGQLAHLWYTYGALEASFSARACHGCPMLRPGCAASAALALDYPL